MTVVALLISLCILALGVLGLVSPRRLLELVRRVQTPRGLYVAAALRILFGLALVSAAPESRAPHIVGPLGSVVVAIGIVTPLFGLERFRHLLGWWSRRSDGFLRVWSAVTIGFATAILVALQGPP